MGDNTTFSFNPQGPPGADGAGGAGAAVGGASEAAASAGGPILGDAAPFQFWDSENPSVSCLKNASSATFDTSLATTYRIPFIWKSSCVNWRIM